MRLLLLASIFVPRAVFACGGFFCSQAPVVQTAERIIFEMRDDRVTAYVQLQYAGFDPNFAWVVPVPDVPEVDVDVPVGLFEALDTQTKPIIEDYASESVADFSSGCGGWGGNPGLTARLVPTPQVSLWKNATVGPYEYAVVSADSATDLENWLLVNGYQPVPGSAPIIQAYLDEGMKLLALKLSPQGVGSALTPIRIQYSGSGGCQIPLRLTAIAAAPQLEVLVWVFGEGPVRPENYVAVPRDWEVYSAADYEVQLKRAVGAAGRGFVTELAQPTLYLEGTDPILADILSRNVFVTRLRTFIDPVNMTVDPSFVVDHQLPQIERQVPVGASFAAWAGVALLMFGLLVRKR